MAAKTRQCDTPRHPPPESRHVCSMGDLEIHLVVPPGKQEAGRSSRRGAQPNGSKSVRRLRPLVNGALGDLGKGFVSRLLFLQCLLQKRHGVFKAKLFR